MWKMLRNAVVNDWSKVILRFCHEIGSERDKGLPSRINVRCWARAWRSPVNVSGRSYRSTSPGIDSAC